MPPAVRFTKEEIVTAALEIARQSGLQAVTARAVAQGLGASPKVIFGLFQSMEQLHQALEEAAYQHYLSFLRQDMASGNYPSYKAMGMGYIRFAIEEPVLFRMLYMSPNGRADAAAADYELAVEMIMNALGIPREQANLLQFEMWACVHGIATMHATGYLSLEWSLISQILTDTYQGLRKQILSRRDEHECN